MSMKRTTLLFPAVVSCLLSASCTDWPYDPVQFKTPDLTSVTRPRLAFVPKDSLVSFCGTGDVTLLYNYAVPGLLLQTLYYVHLSDSNATAVQLKKPAGRGNWKADSPMPSPDGTLVTYYMFSASGDFASYIQKLDSTAEPLLIAEHAGDPHFYKDPQGNLFVTYADTTGILLSSLDSITSNATFRQRVDAVSGQKIGPPAKLANKPFYGGLSRDGNYLSTGYADAYLYDTSTATLYPVNSGLQTCNPSTSTDPLHPDRMMFLNYSGIQNLGGYAATSIDMHKVVFIVDRTNTVVSSFDVNGVIGASKGEWQDPEWSNNPDYFAALASDGARWDVYLVKISSKKALRLTTDSFRVNDSSAPFVFIAGGAS
jgi:Tol biopolymer transport system component